MLGDADATRRGGRRGFRRRGQDQRLQQDLGLIPVKVVSYRTFAGTVAVATDLVELKAADVLLESAVVLARRVPAFAQGLVLVRVAVVQRGDDLQGVLLLGGGATAALGAQRFREDPLQILSLGWTRLSAEQTVDVVVHQPVAGKDRVDVQVVVSRAVQRPSRFLRLDKVGER